MQKSIFFGKSNAVNRKRVSIPSLNQPGCGSKSRPVRSETKLTALLPYYTARKITDLTDAIHQNLW